MTYQQAYYRQIFQQYGVTDEALRKCAFCANLVVQYRVDQLAEEVNPKPSKIQFYYPEPLWKPALKWMMLVENVQALHKKLYQR